MAVTAMAARKPPDLVWQTNLWAGGDERVTTDQSTNVRLDLGDGSWVDHHSCFLLGSDALFSRLVADAPWFQPEVTMYERKVAHAGPLPSTSINRPGVRLPVNEPPFELAVVDESLSTTHSGRK